MNIKNKIDVTTKILKEMKQAIDCQLANASKQIATNNEQMRINYENERKIWNEGGAEVFDAKEIWVKFNGSKIRVRIYYPDDKEEYATIFFIHGGGWVVGSIDTHDRIMRNLAYASGCAVVGIDYSLAPEKKFPYQLMECDAVVKHFKQNFKEYKISPKFIAYAGDSAGANMCMGLFLYQRNNGEDLSHIRAMALYYGLYGLKDSASRVLYGDEIDWLRQEDIEYYYKEYLSLNDDMESEFVNILNADLTFGIPPCFIAACEFDPLKDDSVALYKIIQEHNSSKFKEYKGVIHAFLHFSKIMKTANDAIEDGAKFIKNEFEISLKELK